MKVALITGASRGIGLAIAVKLASQGYNLALNYVGSEEEIRPALETLSSYDVEVSTHQTDVSDFSQVQDMIANVIDHHKQIDVLVNNAGITKDNLLMRMTEEEFDAVINVNLKGAFNCIRHITRPMLKQRYGSIINISSVSGVSGNAGQANYSASKAGLIGLTKTTAKELSSRNIRVNAIAPGFIETKMTDDLNEKVKEAMLKGIPLNRYGKPEDVANLVAFLASDESSYITGQVINLDGGMVM